MKNTNKILFIAAVSAMALVSCSKMNDYPTFNPDDSFAAFDQIAYSVDENCGTLTIPVSIASIDPEKVNVALKAVDSTAKAGVNYELVGDGVLRFDGKLRTMAIDVKINDKSGEYTGDLVFCLELVSAGGLKIGANNTCTVTISDLDHPLAAILGEYTGTGFDYFDGAAVNWNVNFMKDAKDVTVLWIDAPTASFQGTYPSGDYRIYAKVAEDQKSFTVPLGQVLASKASGKTVSLWSFNGSSVYSSGSVTFTLDASGKTFTIEEGFGWGIGYLTDSNSVSLFDLYSPGTSSTPAVSFTKK